MGLVLALMGMKEEAIEVYKRCSHLDGSGLKDPRTHETTKISALFNLGRLYADDGQYMKAVDVYNEAIQRMPAHYQPQVCIYISSSLYIDELIRMIPHRTDGVIGISYIVAVQHAWRGLLQDGPTQGC